MSRRDARAKLCESVSAICQGNGLKILMTPDYRRDNPYQALLSNALEDLGATVSFPRGYRRVFPLRRMLGQDGPHPDVLHLHWLAPYVKGRSSATKAVYAVKFVLDLLLVRRAGVRLVWTVHNLVEHEQMHPRIEVWCRRRLARLADAIIVHSDQARDLVAENYDAQATKISVIPHGHYRDAYGPPIPSAEARAKLGLPQEGRVFLFFGMVRPYKGVLKLLSSWAGSPELHERHTLVIAGEAQDPEYMEMVRRSAEATPSVRLCLGRVPDDQVTTFLSAANGLIVPLENVLTSGSAVLAESYRKGLIAPRLSPDTFFPRDKEATAAATQECVQLAKQMVSFAENGYGTTLARRDKQDPPSWLEASTMLLNVVRRTLDANYR